MNQRILLIGAFLVMVLLVGATTIFFSSKLAVWQNADASPVAFTAPSTAIPTPTDTPTPLPTPTPSPTPLPLVNGSSAFLVDVTSGRVLLDVNSHLRVSM